MVHPQGSMNVNTRFQCKSSKRCSRHFMKNQCVRFIVAGQGIFWQLDIFFIIFHIIIIIFILFCIIKHTLYQWFVRKKSWVSQRWVSRHLRCSLYFQFSDVTHRLCSFWFCDKCSNFMNNPDIQSTYFMLCKTLQTFIKGKIRGSSLAPCDKGRKHTSFFPFSLLFQIRKMFSSICPFSQPGIWPLSAVSNSWMTKKRSNKEISDGWEQTPKPIVHLWKMCLHLVSRRTLCASVSRQCVPHRHWRDFLEEEGQQSRTLQDKHSGKQEYDLRTHTHSARRSTFIKMYGFYWRN